MASIRTLRVGSRPFILKELQPSADRVSLAGIGNAYEELVALLTQFARLAAWSHLRCAGRLQCAPAERLQHYARQPRLASAYCAAARKLAAHNLHAWQQFVHESGATPAPKR